MKYRLTRVACCVCIVAAMGALVFAGVSSVLPSTPEAIRDATWDFKTVAVQDADGNVTTSDGSLPATEENILSTASGSYMRNEVLLSFEGTIDEADLRERLAQTGVEVANVSLVSKSLDNNRVLVCVTYEGDADPAELSERLASSDFVSSVQPNYTYTLSELDEDDASSSDDQSDDENAMFVQSAQLDEADGSEESDAVEETALQSELSATSINDPKRTNQWQLDAVKAYDAWDSVKASGSVTVAVIDSGVDVDHPDLVGNLILSSAKNTYTEKVGSAAVDDVQGHGTHVSGIIAATANNNVGVAGISYNAKILPVRVTCDSSGNMNDEDIIEAVYYVADLKKNAKSGDLANIRVINMSFGGDSVSAAFKEAVNYAYAQGILLVAASGNNSPLSSVDYPAKYDHVIGVGAMEEGWNSSYSRASYSHYGTGLDLAAPGSDVYSTIPSGYGYKSGTSMASPCVAGVAALVFACNMSFTPDQVESILESTAVDYGDKGWDKYYGYGLVNAKAAVAAAIDESKTNLSAVTVSGISAQTYTGSALTPEPTVTYGGKILTKGTDYTVSYSNNINAGTATVTITAVSTSNYKGSKSVNFTINKASLSGATIGSIAAKTYTGSALTPEPTVTLNTKTLSKGTDYTVSYSNNINAGTATVTVTAVSTSNYKDSKSANFTISKANLAGATIASIGAKTYTGSALTPEPTVTFNSKTLSKGTDYTVSYANNTNAGTATVTVTAVSTGNFTGSKSANFAISKADVNMSGITFGNQTFTYDGLSHSLAIDGTLPTGVSVSYANNGKTAASTYTVTANFALDATRSANYNVPASKTATLTINKADVDMSGITFSSQSFAYDGSSHSLAINGSLPAGVSVSYTGNSQTAVGVYTVTASFALDATRSANYNVPASKTATLTIGKANLSEAVIASIAALTYTGNALTPEPTVTYESKTLVKGTDYTVSYANNTNAGTATVTVTATNTGSYTGKASKDFTINKANLSGATIGSIAAKTYTGSALTPEPNVTFNGKTLTKGTDYTVSYANNINAGMATVTVTAVSTSNFTGTTSANFTIGKASLSGATIANIGAKTYTGSAITPEPSVTFNNKTLSKGTDYTVGYANNINVGTATVTVTAVSTGNFTGSKSANFAINKADVDMSGITFGNQTFTYDGSPHSLAIGGTLPSGVSVSYTNNGKSAIGSHTVTANFALDATRSANYNVPASKTATLTIVDKPYKISVSLSGLSDVDTTAYVDGNAFTVTKSGSTASFYADSANAQVLTMYSYNKTSGDTHTIYPTHMYVWFLTLQSDNSYVAARQSDLDDVLIYEGSSIRVTGKKGIRLITGIPTTTRTSLINGWRDSSNKKYTLQEYGTLLEFDYNLKGAAITLNNATHSGAAYRKGTLDAVYSSDANEVMYTNVLVGFTTAQCADDLSMRSYLKIADSSGTVRTIYGGIVHRSIKYIAQQNQNAFAAGTDAYNFIWGIINGV